MAQRMCPYREFLEWVVFYNQDPWGPERADLNAGIISATIANVNRGKNQKAYAPKDFMPEYGKKQRRKLTDPKAQQAYLRALAAMSKGKRGK